MAALSSLKFRIAIVIFLLEGMMMAVVLWQSLGSQTEALRARREVSEQALVNLIARVSRTALLTEEYGELKYYFDHMQQDPRVERVLLANKNGKVVASADLRDLGQPAPVMVNTDLHHWHSMEITNATGVLGALHVNFSRGDVLKAQAEARRLGIQLALIGMTIIAIVGVGIGFLLTRRLDRLAATAQSMATGDLHARANLSGHDEVAAVGRAFDLMADQVASNQDDLEAQIRARTTALETANRELEAFSYSVSHDLRAPLRAVDGFSQALLEDYGNKLDATGRNYLERVRSGAQTMGALIDDLLKLARVTRASLQPQAVDLSNLAREITDNLRKQFPDRAAHIDIAEGLHVLGDPGLMRVALENLLQNAWKYTSNQSCAEICFDALQQDDETIFRIRDNGVGFDMKFAGKLFGAFQRLHHKDQFEGTGIGLATVQRIIHRHGGRVWAEAKPGQGASFFFTLGHSVQAQPGSSLQ